MRWRWMLWMVVLCLLGSRPANAGDRLNAARSSARGSSSGSSSGGSSSSWDDDDDDDDDGPGLLALIFSNDDDDDDGTAAGSVGAANAAMTVPFEFLPYPYANGRDGYHVHDEKDRAAAKTRPLVLHLGTEGSYLYEDVWRTSANLRILAPRAYVSGRYDFMLEGPTPKLDGDLEVTGTVRDRLHFGNLGVGFHLSPGDLLSIRMGVMGTVMADDRRSLPAEPSHTLGVGAELEADLYPIKPLVISARGAAVKFPGAWMYEARITAGVAINRVEIYAGYDHRGIGKVPLGGPVVGVRLRF